VTRTLAAVAIVAGNLVFADNGDADIFTGSSWDGSLRCGSAVDTRLRELGLSLDQMRDVRWHTDTFAREGDVGQLSGVRFLGRPPSCAEGSVAITMWPDCGIQEIRTRGGCEVAGIKC